MEDIHFASASAIANGVADRSMTAVEVAEAFLKRIALQDRLLNSFVVVMPDQALDAAQRVDDAVRAGRAPGPLAGVPVAVKDLIDMAGVTTTAGAHRLFHVTAREDAPVITQLRGAGAVIVGKTGLHEFAYGVTNANPHTGSVRNPWDRSRTPGGSSGGSAAAVAAGLCAVALGSDTGGSIRIPASLCGVTGLKPTYGTVPTSGAVPLSWGLDHLGPLTRTATDAGLVLSVLAAAPQRAAEMRRDIAGLRVGVPRHFFWEDLDPAVEAACRDAVSILADLGAAILDVVIPHAHDAGAAATIILSAEAAAYHELRLREQGEAFGEDVRVKLDRGLFVPAVDYVVAQRARAFLTREFIQTLRDIDVLVTPTTVAPAAPLEEVIHSTGASLAMSLEYTRFTYPFNLTGLPALSVPCGFTEQGLPIGLQIAGRPFDETTVLRVGHAYQQVTEWHLRRPPLQDEGGIGD